MKNKKGGEEDGSGGRDLGGNCEEGQGERGGGRRGERVEEEGRRRYEGRRCI